MRLEWNSRTRRLLFVVVMLFVRTFPLVNTLLTRSRVDRDGVDVAATVAKAVDDDGRYLVAFRLLEDDPKHHHVEGEIYSKAPWIFTLVSDAIVLLVGLWWVRVGRRRPTLKML